MIANRTRDCIIQWNSEIYRTYVEANGISRDNGRTLYVLCEWKPLVSLLIVALVIWWASASNEREWMHVPISICSCSIDNNLNKHTFSQMTWTRKFLIHAQIAVLSLVEHAYERARERNKKKCEHDTKLLPICYKLMCLVWNWCYALCSSTRQTENASPLSRP